MKHSTRSKSPKAGDIRQHKIRFSFIDNAADTPARKRWS
jgi:hypothetical protein